jgi:hypothetical protein
MAASKSVVLTFEIFRGSEFLRREESSSESVTIGKGAAALLRVEDPALHDLHVVLNVNEDGSVQLHDLAGDRSTVVNGKPVDSNVVLASNDAISIGPVRIVVRVTDEAAFADEEATRVNAPVISPTPVGLGKAPVAAPVALGKQAAAPTPVATPSMDAGDDTLAVDQLEDVMAYVMRASASANEAAADRSRGKVLEVSQVYGDSLLAVKLFGKGGRVMVGSTTQATMKLFGFPVTEVASSMVNILPVVTLGVGSASEHWKNPFYVPSETLPTPDYPLFTSQGGNWVCNFSDSWAGFIDQGETRKTFQELIASGQARRGNHGYQVDIAEDARLMVDLGTTLFVAHQVYPSKKAVVPFGDNIDYPFLVMVASAALSMAMLFAAIQLVPPPDATEQKIDPRLVEMLLDKEVKPEEEKQPDAGEGAKAKKEEGKVGKKDAKMDKAKGEKIEKQKMDREVAENAGLLGALRDDASLDSSMANNGVGAMQNGIGGLIGAVGTQVGSGGLGGRGGGIGGGGSADGLGGMGTRGRGSGSSGYGSGGGDFGQRGEGAVAGVGGDPIILGALDKSLIDAVIKRNMAAIRYCYQRELTKNPALAGKITVKFVIAADGTVSSATTKSSSMGNPAVEGCINGRFLRFQFPQPKGGGIVIVSYPFIFSPG